MPSLGAHVLEFYLAVKKCFADLSGELDVGSVSGMLRPATDTPFPR